MAADGIGSMRAGMRCSSRRGSSSRVAISGSRPSRESAMYAAIRQGRAKAGKAEELTRRIKEGAIPVISGVDGFMGYYVVYAPDDTVIAISLFNNFAAAEESNKRACVDRTRSRAVVDRARDRAGGSSDRAHAGLICLTRPLKRRVKKSLRLAVLVE